MVRATSGETTSWTSGCASSSKRAVVTGDTTDHVRVNTNSVVGENCESRNVLEKAQVRRTES